MSGALAGSPRRTGSAVLPGVRSATAVAGLVLAGCVSTTTASLVPAPQSPVCARGGVAQVLWTTQWRVDQKDVAARDAAAAQGIERFFATSGCFDAVSIGHVRGDRAFPAEDTRADARTRGETVLLIAVRELGPTLRIGASPALFEGGTEVVLDLTVYPAAQAESRTFSVRWRSGGPGVVKGVATLPQDMRAALAAGLQPAAR